MYSHSTKAQLINPRKVYAIDLGMVNSISTKPTKDKGQKFENLIFLHLRQYYKEIYYLDHKGKGECDFIAFNHGNIEQIVQVCYELTPDNTEREIKGLTEAMRFFNHHQGTIVTLSQKDKITHNGVDIEVMPAHVFLGK